MSKGVIGFKTPAMELQEAMAEQLSMLDAQEKTWAEVLAWADEERASTRRDLERLPASERSSLSVIGFRQFCIISRLIARLGLEMTETHKRLAKVERDVKELKRAAKC